MVKLEEGQGCGFIQLILDYNIDNPKDPDLTFEPEPFKDASYPKPPKVVSYMLDFHFFCRKGSKTGRGSPFFLSPNLGEADPGGLGACPQKSRLSSDQNSRKGSRGRVPMSQN
jgi:hypothetical protein